MVEGAALEMLFRGNFNEGSNPSLSVHIRDAICASQQRFAIALLPKCRLLCSRYNLRFSRTGGQFRFLAVG